jgi:hypothetical protein
MMFSMIMEALLAVLLAATVTYCAILEKRLRVLRNDQAGLGQIIRDLNVSIVTAQNSLRALHGAAGEAEQKLSHHVGKARALADELSLLASAGERIASRMERSRPESEQGSRVIRAPSSARNAASAFLTENLSPDLAGLRAVRLL